VALLQTSPDWNKQDASCWDCSELIPPPLLAVLSLLREVTVGYGRLWKVVTKVAQVTRVTYVTVVKVVAQVTQIIRII